MELIRKKAFARAGLIGNPSDGYHGKTISIGLGNLWAQVSLYEWEQVEIIWSQEDRSRFDSIEQLADDVVLHGYYGGVRLVKATIKNSSCTIVIVRFATKAIFRVRSDSPVRAPSLLPPSAA